jgi:hypothetical protein
MSVRAAKSAPNSATFASGGDPACTGPGGASKNPACAGPGGAASARVSFSSRRSRAFAARSSTSSLAACAGIARSASRSCTLITLRGAAANKSHTDIREPVYSAASQPTGSGDPAGLPYAAPRRADAILARGRWIIHWQLVWLSESEGSDTAVHQSSSMLLTCIGSGLSRNSGSGNLVGLQALKAIFQDRNRPLNWEMWS